MERFHISDRFLNHPELAAMVATFRQQSEHLPAEEAKDLWKSFKDRIEKKAVELGIPEEQPHQATALIRIFIMEKKVQQEIEAS
jgi:hypothetical protein